MIVADALNARDEAAVAENVAAFVIPLTQQTGETTITLQMSYGYCSADSSLCRLASHTWLIPIQIAEDNAASDLNLSFSHPSAAQ